MLKAQRAEAAALLQRDVADNARQAAETERQRADNEAAIARAVVQFLQNDLLRQADTQYQVATRHDPDTNLTVRAALDRAAEAVDQRFESQPAVESAVRRTIGVAYIGLGEFPKAVVHLKESQALAEKVYGSDHENTHQCQYDYATSLRMVGEFDVAIPLLQKTVAFRQTSPGPNHRNTLAAMTQLAIVFDKVGRHDEASQLFSDVYERATASNANAAVIISALNNLAMCDANRGQLDAVIKRLEALKERWSILTDMPQQVELLNNLGQMYLRARRYDDAIREFTISLAAARKRFSPEHPTLITTTYFLFEAYLHADRKDDAGELIETAHRACRDRVGPNHIRTYLITLKMAEWALATGNTDRGIQLAQSVLRAIENAPRATYTRMSAQVILAHGLLLAGRASEAEPLARAAAGTTGRPDDWLQYHARLVLGKSLASQAKTDEAGPQIEQGRAGLIRHEHQLPFIVRQLLK
jgi:tetratricopeptide (TPR) repeat protein